MQLTIKTKLFGLTISGLMFVASRERDRLLGHHVGAEDNGRSCGHRLGNSKPHRGRESITISPEPTRPRCSRQKAMNSRIKWKSLRSTASYWKIASPKRGSFAVDPASRSMLDNEKKMVESVRKGGRLAGECDYPQSQRGLPDCSALTCSSTRTFRARSKRPAINWKGAKEAELSAAKKGARATRAMFVMCGLSLLLLLFLAASP